jgi:hypothetical protein
MKQEQNNPGLLRRNLLVTFILVVVLLLLYVSVPGYHWAITEMAVRNKELIDRIETRRLNTNMPELTMDDKRLFKISNYWYLKYLRENTPENAVILLPPHSAIDTSEEMKFLNSAEWVEYFIFPRLCVGEDDKEKSKALYEKVTHVAIVNGWGYDKLHYSPEKRTSEIVLPIDSLKK